MIVYFIQSGTRGPIKVGTTGDLSARLHQLRTASPVEVRLLGAIPGGKALERELHRMLAKYRIRGEWFKPAPDVRRFAYLAGVIDGRHPEEVARWQIVEELRPLLRRKRLLPGGPWKSPGGE